CLGKQAEKKRLPTWTHIGTPGASVLMRRQTMFRQSVIACLVGATALLGGCSSNDAGGDSWSDEAELSTRGGEPAPACIAITKIDPDAYDGHFYSTQFHVQNDCSKTQNVRVDLASRVDTVCKEIKPGTSDTFETDVWVTKIKMSAKVRGLALC